MLLSSPRARTALAVLLVVFAAVRAAWAPLREGADPVFFGLVAFALLVVLVPWDRVPWERVTGVDVGGVGITLDLPQVDAAITAAFPVDRLQGDSLKRRLEELGDDLAAVPGSRALWVDDRPDVVLAERRILRALGVDVVVALSTEEAIEALRRDGDFDLLITDVQRPGGRSHEVVGGVPLHEGTNFVVRLRRGEVDDRLRTAPVTRLPVIFYAAYPRDRLLRFTEAARVLEPVAEATEKSEELIVLVCRRLAQARKEPIEVSHDEKGAT